jgi:hypothetical protein
MAAKTQQSGTVDAIWPGALRFRVGQIWEASDGWRYKILLVEDDGAPYPVVARRLAADNTPLGDVVSFKLDGHSGADGYRLKKLVPKTGTLYVNAHRDGSFSVHKGLKAATLGADADIVARMKVKYREGKYDD